MSFDRAGNRFICMNRVPVQHVVFESKWLRRNPRLAFSETVQDCNARDAFNGINGGHDGVRLFPISSNITTADGHAGSFSAACGVKIWRGPGLTPACDGAVLSCDPTGNLVHADRLTPRGATFAASPLFSNRELLASRDDWFRPVFLAEGPEEALYVADMYRKVIEHPDYLPEEVRKHTDFETGKNLGRIWRVRAESPFRGKVAQTEPTAATPRQLFLDTIGHGDNRGIPETINLLAANGLRYAEDKWMRYAVLSGVRGVEKEVLGTLLVHHGKGSKVGPGLAEIIGHLAGGVGDPGDWEKFTDEPVSVRLAMLDGYLSEKGRRPDGLPADFRELMEAAPAMALDDTRSPAERVVAVRLMSRLPWARSGGSLLKLASEETFPEWSAAALRAVVAYPQPEVSAALLADWSRYTPARRDAVLGALLGVPFHLKAVLAAVEGRRISAGVFTGVRRRQVLASKDPAIKAQAERLLTVSVRPEALAEASKALELKPNPSEGRTVFRAVCATCHRLDREGHAVGPDLFDIRRQTKDNILFHIVNPDAEIAPAFTAYLAEAKDGRVLSGILVGDSPTSITLRGPLGIESTLLRADLVKLEALPGSLMPTGLEAGLSQQQLADLLAHLKGEK
jgi:putative heme-binding domain-containing protein